VDSSAAAVTAVILTANTCSSGCCNTQSFPGLSMVWRSEEAGMGVDAAAAVEGNSLAITLFMKANKLFYSCK